MRSHWCLQKCYYSWLNSSSTPTQTWFLRLGRRGLRPHHPGSVWSFLISEAKLSWAWLVLGWEKQIAERRLEIPGKIHRQNAGHSPRTERVQVVTMILLFMALVTALREGLSYISVLMAVGTQSKDGGILWQMSTFLILLVRSMQGC